MFAYFFQRRIVD